MPLKIALISDSHSYLDHKALKFLEEVDEVWHAGDVGDPEVLRGIPEGKVIRGVYGNIDDASVQELFPEWLEFELEGVKVLMTHIGGKPPRYAKGVREKIKNAAPMIFVCGHSHICKVEWDPVLNCLYMNPGAIGQQGFHQVKTMLLFELNTGKVTKLRVVELGKRGSV
jgi:putative phosphoesterase